MEEVHRARNGGGAGELSQPLGPFTNREALRTLTVQGFE